MIDSDSPFFLAIEAAIGGGSVALARSGERIDGIIGGESRSRSEDVLPNIDALLLRNHIDRSEINKVVVSAGPGSFTGIRIGIATAYGLGDALNVPVRPLSLLAAIALASGESGQVLAALPVGRDNICVQRFIAEGELATARSAPEASNFERFIDMCRNHAARSVVVSSSLFVRIPDDLQVAAIDIGSDLAWHLARFEHFLEEVSEPLFIGMSK